MNSPPDRPARAIAVAFTLVALIGTVRVLPQINIAMWQDEAATLLLYASGSVAQAFADYSLPNNHLLLSAVLAALWSPADDPAPLRLVLLVTWLATLACLACAPARLSAGARLLGMALFVGSSVSAAFALQLRGYAFSWPFVVLAFATAAAYVVDGNRVAGAGFVAASLALVAILPTNALAGGLAVAWALVLALAAAGAPRQAILRRGLAAAVAAVAPLLIYLPHRAALAGHAARGWGTWSDTELLAHAFLASTLEFVLLAPLLVAGLVLAARDAAGRRPRHLDAGLALAVVLAVGVAAVVLLVPAKLFPRVLVPLLPMWCAALGSLMLRGAVPLAAHLPRLPSAAIAAAALGVFALVVATPTCPGMAGRTPRAMDLCSQFHRHAYHPAAALDYLSTQRGPTRETVMLSGEAAWAFALLLRNNAQFPVGLVDFKAWPQAVGEAHKPRLVVAADPAELRRMFSRLGWHAAPDVRLLHDSGYFKIWQLEW